MSDQPETVETEVPQKENCGCGPSCKGCGSSTEAPPAHTPRPERVVKFVPNNPDEFFTYEESEYQLVIERLRRYAEDWPQKRDDLLEKIAKMDPEKEGAFGPVLSATTGWVQLTILRKWAAEVLKATEKDGESEDAAVDENGHKVNEQECPFLFFNLQIQRRSLAKTLIDSTRQGALGADFSGLINNEALAAMSVFIDDFVHISPSLKKVDLGNRDPLINTL